MTLTTHSPANDAGLATLAAEIERLSRGAGGPVGVSATHLETGRRVSMRGSEAFPMASVYKVAIAVELLRRVDAGELKLTDLTPCDHRTCTPAAACSRGR